MEFILTYFLVGFISVFGWNSGQKVWDKYIEPEIPKVEAVKNDTAK